MRLVQLTTPVIALVFGLAVLAPVPTFGQNNLHQLGIAVHNVPAGGDSRLRVTVAHPAGEGAIDDSGEIVIIVGAGPSGGGHVRRTLEPGASFTFTLDPRVDGQSVDPRWDLYHVPVRLWIESEIVEGRNAPQPAVTIEIVHAKTGALQSVHVFPGFIGGVRVSAADIE